MPFMDSFRRAHNSSPAPSNASMSSTSSRLSQEEIEEILTSPYETGYTYSQSAAYRREGSVDYRYPQLCRQYSAYSNYTASPSLEEEFRHIYRAVASPRRNIVLRIIRHTFVLLKTLIVFVFAAITYAFLLVFRGLKYLLGWLLHYFVLVPLFSPYYAAKQKYYEAKYAFNAANYLFGYAKRLFLWVRSLWSAPEVTLYEENENDELVLRSGHRYSHGHQHNRSACSILNLILVWTLYVVSLGVVDFIPSSQPTVQHQPSDLKSAAPTHPNANGKPGETTEHTAYAVLKTIIQLLLFVGTLGIYDPFTSSTAVEKATFSSSIDSSIIRAPEDDYRARDRRGRAGFSAARRSCVGALSSIVGGLWKGLTTAWSLAAYALTLGFYNSIALNYQRNNDDSSIASRVRSRAAKQPPASDVTTTTMTKSSISYYANRPTALTLAAVPKGLAYCLEVTRLALWTLLIAGSDALWWLMTSIGGLFLFLFGGIVSAVYWALSTSGDAVVWSASAIANGVEALFFLLYALVTLQVVREPAAVLSPWSPKHTSTPAGILKTSKAHKLRTAENGRAWMRTESAGLLLTWLGWALLLLPLLALLIFLFQTAAREIQEKKASVAVAGGDGFSIADAIENLQHQIDELQAELREALRRSDEKYMEQLRQSADAEGVRGLNAKINNIVAKLMASERQALSAEMHEFESRVRSEENVERLLASEAMANWWAERGGKEGASAAAMKRELDQKIADFVRVMNERMEAKHAQLADELRDLRASHHTLLAAYQSGVIAANADERAGAGSSSSVETDESVYLDRVRQLIKEHIERYDADKTGMADYALESSGASIASIRCTVPYTERSRTQMIFGIPLWYTSYSPRSVIQRKGYGASAGECWAFVGAHGYLTIKLSNRIDVSAISYEHLPARLSPDGTIRTAPKEFLIYSYQEVDDLDSRFLIGNYTYDERGDPLQTFQAQHQDPRHTPIVEMEVISNHGAMLTCLYRLRVHGQLVAAGVDGTERRDGQQT